MITKLVNNSDTPSAIIMVSGMHENHIFLISSSDVFCTLRLINGTCENDLCRFVLKCASKYCLFQRYIKIWINAPFCVWVASMSNTTRNCVSREHYLHQVEAIIKLNFEYLFQPKKTEQTYLCSEVENLPPILTQISTLSNSAIIHIAEKKIKHNFYHVMEWRCSTSSRCWR